MILDEATSALDTESETIGAKLHWKKNDEKNRNIIGYSPQIIYHTKTLIIL